MRNNIVIRRGPLTGAMSLLSCLNHLSSALVTSLHPGFRNRFTFDPLCSSTLIILVLFLQNSLDHRIIILITGWIFVCQCTVQCVWSVPTGISDTLRVSFEQWHSDCFVSAAFGTKSHSLLREGCAAVSVNLLVLFLLHKSNRLLAVVDKYFRLWNSAVSTSLYMGLCF